MDRIRLDLRVNPCDTPGQIRDYPSVSSDTQHIRVILVALMERIAKTVPVQRKCLIGNKRQSGISRE